MSFIYTRAMLKTRINAGIQGKIGMLISSEDTMNESVREVTSDFDLQSARRKATLTPKLFSDIFDYAAPSDLDMNKITDLPPQVKRDGQEFFMITPEEFDRKKENVSGFIALDEFNNTSILKIALDVDDKQQTVSDLDSLTSGGGTWAAFGDAENVEADSDNFVKGAGSIKFDISAAGGTTAGIKNTGLNSFDMSDFLNGNGAAFAWVYLTDKTNVTNLIVELGSSESAFHRQTVTSRHDGTGFVDGWNLIRWDMTSLSDTGTPTDTAITYAAVYMTKAAGKVSETDYRVDWLVLKRGEIYDIKYYTKYGWTTSTGAYIENSTSDSDLLVASKTEFNLITLKGREIAAREVLDFDLASQWENKYEKKLAQYKLLNPSEAKIQTNEYYNYETNENNQVIRTII